MKTHWRWMVFVVLSIPVLSLSVNAAGEMDKASLEKLLSGNTVEGSRIKWKTTYKMHLDSAGTYSRIDSLNNKERGTWKVMKDGTLMMTGRKKGKEQERTVKQRTDGAYEVYNARGMVIWTIDKVTPGNPYQLQH